MGTGITSYSDPASLSTLFPFASSPVVLVVVGTLAWLGFHVWQVRNENREFRDCLEAETARSTQTAAPE